MIHWQKDARFQARFFRDRCEQLKDQATRNWERCSLFLAQQSIRRPHSIWWNSKACNSPQITQLYNTMVYICNVFMHVHNVILIQQMDCWCTLSSSLPCWHFLYLIVGVVTLVSAIGQQYYCNSHYNRILRLRGKLAAPNSSNSIAQFYNNVLQDYNYILCLWFLHSYPPCFSNFFFFFDVHAPGKVVLIHLLAYTMCGNIIHARITYFLIFPRVCIAMERCTFRPVDVSLRML